MARTITIKNVSGVEKTYAGQTIVDTATYTLQNNEYEIFKLDSSLFADVSTGAALIGNGSSDITNPVAGWEWLQNDVKDVTITQKTEALGGKVAVHSSPKPEIAGIETFVVWTGAGDNVTDPNNPVLGDGDLLNFQLTIGNPLVTKDVVWSQEHFGRVWIHEAYLKFSNGGNGDFITAVIVAKPSTVLDAATVAALESAQQIPPGAIPLDLELDGVWVKFAAGGPGTGTHGFGATPNLNPRGFSLDGDWDYNGVNLTPNFSGTGGYKISTTEQVVHKFVNKIPCNGDCATYFMMSSDETAEVRNGYFLRITAHNVSNTNWSASVIMETYRERTT